jgi:hypothetical protein
LPFADKRDFEELKGGLIAPMKDLKIMADAGHVAWDMERFQFLDKQDEFDSIHLTSSWTGFSAASSESALRAGLLLVFRLAKTGKATKLCLALKPISIDSELGGERLKARGLRARATAERIYRRWSLWAISCSGNVRLRVIGFATRSRQWH